jgi:flagellar hook-associated protein 3 FlgL
MLDNQNVLIKQDVTDVSAVDVAALATKLMEEQTVYNMSLALGARILPQSLADYLS